MLSHPEAFDLLAREFAPLPPQELPLAQALGLQLAETLFAAENLPLTDNSAVDGFGVIASETSAASEAAPVRLRVAGEVPAGRVWPGELLPGQAIRIFTGAPVPAGVTGIAMVEHTRTDAAAPGEVLLLQPVARGAHIRPAGADVQAGAPVLEAGERLDPGALGVLAATGHARVWCIRRPRVGVLMSGDELVDPSQPVRPGQVRDVSSSVLMAALAQMGVEAEWLGRAGDTVEALRERLKSALPRLDVLLTAGGVSMGAYDLLRPTLRDLGVSELFWKVAQRPGKPLVVGRGNGGLWWFGLPGNPVSVWTCFQLYVVPMLRRLMGDAEPDHPEVTVLAGERLHTPGALTYLLRARLHEVGGRLAAYLTGAQGSNITSSMVGADVILVVPPEVDAVMPGQPVQALVIDQPRFARIAAAHLAVLQRTGGRVTYMEGVDPAR